MSNDAVRCLDEVPPFDGATAREMIRQDLGRAPSQVFQHFEESPLSAASIGQVHACVLPDGREAVIKLAPDWALARDLYLVKNVFPEAVKEKAAREGLVLPDRRRVLGHG